MGFREDQNRQLKGWAVPKWDSIRPVTNYKKGGPFPSHLYKLFLSFSNQAKSKRSRFITLDQAATKSFTNFACESSQP